MTLLRLVYNLFFPVVLLVMLPGFVVRMLRRGNYRHKFGQRFGIYSRRVKEKLAGHRWTWVHAVSVGEVMIALKLIGAMRERWPELRVVLSTTTSTGYRLAHRRRSAWLEPIYHPLDLAWSAGRAMNVIRPERLILVEAEVWPNVMAMAGRRGVPRVLVNARLSERSEARYRMVRPLSAALFNQLDALCIQDPSDRVRWVGIGVDDARIRLTGSIKFDTGVGGGRREPRDFRPVLAGLGVVEGMPVLLGASTFDGEEEMLARVARELRREFPGLFLVLVPRHAERGRDVLRQLQAAGFRVALRQGGEDLAAAEILIVNTTGELRDWYACADVVFVGKSLAKDARGGQNPAEVIEAGRPVIFGPAMQNFSALARQLVHEGGGLQVGSEAELKGAAAKLLREPGLGEAMVLKGLACLQVHAGATARTVGVIASIKSP